MQRYAVRGTCMYIWDLGFDVSVIKRTASYFHHFFILQEIP